MFNPTILGENIKRQRRKKKLTQAQLAEKMFVTSQAISGWERGITPPDLENLCKLSAFFDVSLDSLVGNYDLVDERLMIGIDGGGTKTEFVLFTESGRILRRLKLAQSNPNDIGIEKCCAVLTEGIDALLDVAPKVCGIFAGIAGCVTGDNAQRVSAYLKPRYKSIMIAVDTDGVNVLACNTDAFNSMALICGTGSVLFVRENGIMHRIGGWGYLFDESGSAYDIGKDAVKAALAQGDGLGEDTVITDLLKEECKSDMWDSLNVVYSKGKPYIASLAPVVFKANELGDTAANRILRKNAAHLASLITTAMAKYNCGSHVVACGGLMEHYKEVLLPMIKESVPENVAFLFPQVPPVYGACVECCRMMDIAVNEKFYDTFHEDYTGG